MSLPGSLRCSLSLLLLCVSLLWSAGEVSRPELSSLFPEEYLSETLPAPGAWNPFPRYDERSFWQELPQRTIDSQLQRAEKNVGQPWPELPATLYMEFATIGNRSNYETSYFERRTRLADLVLAECMEGKGRFTGEIVNGLWLILEESSWTLPAHIGAQRAGKGLPDRNEPIVALFSAETSGLIAWTIYLLEDQLDEVSPLIVPHSKKEVKERILDPCLERDDFWWMSFNTDHINNWNPWVNSNWLA
ncbi:MAG: hypothetical protein HOC20_05140, partial [Chloroflexi bacterium]|nr:hypothetical protein [Chloroflexota bacterium]